MIITIDLSPELESRLRQNATAAGIEPEAYVVSVLAAGVEKARCVNHASVKQRFDSLLATWKKDRGSKSFIDALCSHPVYQQIIGLGPSAVPLLLAEFERTPGHYDWALRAITGENPVPEESRGRLKEMAAAWVQWGKANGYRW